MLYTFFVLMFGIYLGQEYNEQLPNVKKHAIKCYDEFKQTELYKNVFIQKK